MIAAARADLVRLRAQRGDRALADGVVLVADVERRLDPARDDVAGAVGDADLADGRDQAGLLVAPAARRRARTRPRRRARRGAGPSASCPRGRRGRRSARLKRVWPAIAVTTPSGSPSASSTGPCSMWTSKYARAPSNSGSPERRADRVAQRHAVGVGQRRARPASSRPTNARLPRNVDWKRRPSSSANATSSTGSSVERLGHREADQHAEDAVVAAGVGHRVQVRADDQRRPGAAAPGEVAERVAAGLQPRGLHPPAQPGHRRRERGRRERARDPSRLLGEAGELVGPLEHRARRHSLIVPTSQSSPSTVRDDRLSVNPFTALASM